MCVFLFLNDMHLSTIPTPYAAPGPGGGGAGAPGSPSPALPDIPVDLPFALPFDIALPQRGSLSPTRIIIIAASTVAALLAAVAAAGAVCLWRTSQHRKRVAAEAAARRPSRASQQSVVGVGSTPGGSRRSSQLPLVRYPDVLHSLGPPPPLPTTPFGPRT